MPKCVCKTKDGVRCSRNVSVVGDKCYQHEKAGCKFGSAKVASGKKTPSKASGESKVAKTPPKNAKAAGKVSKKSSPAKTVSKAVVCECFTKDGNHCKNKVTVGTMCTRHTNAGGCSNWSPRPVFLTSGPNDSFYWSDEFKKYIKVTRNPSPLPEPVATFNPTVTIFRGPGDKKSRNSTRTNTYKICVAEDQGVRPDMEDTHVIRQDSEFVLAAVFDGHGGSDVSKFVAEYFSKIHISRDMNFAKIIQDLQIKTKGMEGGTTASIVLLDKQYKKMTVVNIGDSRVMTIRGLDSEIVTVDHNVETNREDVAAIRKAGGEIIRMGGIMFYLYDPVTGTGLNVSRAIGDHIHKNLIRTPDIKVMNYSDLDYILISCDGLWERSSQEDIFSVFSWAGGAGNDNYICRNLVKRALDDGSRDNITAIVIDLHV